MLSADVYYVSWGSPRGYPFPEIYNTQEANPQQWYRVALYKNLVYGSTMEFRGGLAQYTACEQGRDPITGQLPPDCIGTNNTAEAAHSQLLGWLSSDPTPTVEVAGIKLPDGIDNHPSIPFSESVVTVLNSWRKTTDDRYYLVYAGFLTQDTQQGEAGGWGFPVQPPGWSGYPLTILLNVSPKRWISSTVL